MCRKKKAKESEAQVISKKNLQEKNGMLQSGHRYGKTYSFILRVYFGIVTSSWKYKKKHCPNRTSADDSCRMKAGRVGVSLHEIRGTVYSVYTGV